MGAGGSVGKECGTRAGDILQRALENRLLRRAGVEDHRGRHRGRQAFRAKLLRDTGDRSDGHEEHDGLCGACGRVDRCHTPLVRPRRDGAESARDAAAREQQARAGRCRAQRTDPREHAIRKPEGLQGRCLLREPSEEARVAALEPHHAEAAAHAVEQCRRDVRLLRVMAAPSLAHIEHLCTGGDEVQQRRIDQRVVEADLAAPEGARRIQRA